MGSLKAVFQWVLRTMMKSKGETGVVQTLPKKDIVELNTQITAQRLMQNGIDPTQLKKCRSGRERDHCNRKQTSSSTRT